jgi:hypothetical protein
MLMNCLTGLAKQEMSKHDFQVIVVSAGADELTHRMTKQAVIKFRMDIRFMCTAENMSSSDARNMGWQHAASPLIAFTEDYCIPDPLWLDELHSSYVLLGKPELAAFSGNSLELTSANCACTRKVLQMTGGFDTRFNIGEDRDLQFKLISKNIPIYKSEFAKVRQTLMFV